MESQLGKISKENDGYQVVFDRVLIHPIEKVWEAITNPEELKYWFTDIELDLRPGAAITFRYRDKGTTSSYGEIVTVEPPNRFAWTWEQELAVWELRAMDEQTTRLVFTYSRLTAEYGVKATAGFHELLDLLEERLDGSDKLSPFGTEESGPGQAEAQVRYAEAVFEHYPELVKNPPVVMEKELDSTIDRVWAAITNKEQLKKWYFDLDDFKPEVGFRFSFPGQGHKGEQYIHLCTVTEVIFQQKLQYSWQYKGHPGYSLVSFELAAVGDKTRMRLIHHGLETFPQDSPDFAWKSFSGGWTEIIGKMLPEFLAKENAS